MFGIGGGEFVLIILVMLMLFGSDKVPEIARTLGKVMKQLKHATNDIKTEIQKSAEANGIDTTSITGGITEEIDKVKQSFNDTVDSTTGVDTNFTTEIEKVKEDIEEITGPIKRQF